MNDDHLAETPPTIDRTQLRRDPTPSPELLASFDPKTFVQPIDDILAVTENPRHRSMLLNYRSHALLEMLGRWNEILNAEMFVEAPFYRIGEMPLVEGYEGIGHFYESVFGDGLTCGLLSHRIAVADWGLAAEVLMYMQVDGSELVASGHEVDPACRYAVTNWSTAIWPFDGDGRLIGEMVYEDPASRRVTRLDPSLVMEPAHVRELMKSLLSLDESSES